MTLRVDFLGHAALLLELDGIRLLTDPATRARIGPLRRVVHVPERHALTDLDAILISHLHWDHLDVPSLRDRGHRAHRRAGRGRRVAARPGFDDVRELAVGSTLEIGGLQVEAVPAHHSGFRPPKGPTASAIGYVIRGVRTVYFAGDTALFPAMAALAGSVDLALLPVWGWGPTLGRGLHMDPLAAAEALRLIRPRAVVPIHWGTYWPAAMGRVYPSRLVEPPAAFVEHAAELAPDVRTLPTDIGDEVTLPRW